MATVTPRQIYQALLSAGASTTQAVGIMANGLAESGLNPEAVGDQGTSFGLWQQHGGQYSGLVTGNPAADMAAQIRVLARNGGFAAANGPTPAAAAGNFSAGYERCTTCQPGQSSYQQRVANAATVAGWAGSGKWPTSAGSASSAAAGTGGGAATNTTDPTCAWGFQAGGSLPIVGNLLSANICVVKKTTLRHIAGGLILAGGGGVLLVGALILAASAFNRSGAQRAVTQVASTAAPARRVVQRAEARQTRERTGRERSAATAARQAERTRRREEQTRRREEQTVKGRHAKTGANAPPQGRHAA